MLPNAKTLGRFVKDAEGTLWMCSPASEISFVLKDARFLSLVLLWNGTCPETTVDRVLPRYAVYLDGEKLVDSRLSDPKTRVAVFESDRKETHTVRLVKLSECSQSLMALGEIATDGETLALPERKLKIEFIGDSITCGYGVDGRAEDTFSTETENAEKSHAYLAGQALGADTVFTSVSGCGLISGYTEGDINEENVMAPVYEMCGKIAWTMPGGKKPQEIPWDFSRFRPDYIVINLGNNDLSWTRHIPEREEMYRRKYREFLTMVRRNNPRARILCALGVFGEDLTDAAREAAEAWRLETGDSAVRFLKLPAKDEERDGAGADHHPSEKTQRLLAQVYIGALTEWMQV
ncbi:MAG: GDSL family lipase [Clostridia bacterium]|nr:GDSL family lipase [Clostridia bacterium]